MKVLVTGASGFIGRYVVSLLHDGGHEVTVITRDIRKINELEGANIKVEMDISNPPDDVYSKLDKPYVAIHLAWDGLPNYESLHHFEKEVPHHYWFLKQLVEAGLPSLLVAGTSFEYGMQNGELSEDLPTFPSNPYGLAKDTLRLQLECLQKQIPFQFTWCRLFYMYGDGQSADSLFSQLKNAVERGDAIFNMSKGEQLRDYLPVQDVARYIVALAISEKGAGLVNVCSGKPISVRSLVENWLKERGWQIDLNLGYYPYPNYEPIAFWGDASRLHSLVCA
jgi:nucleoside-diphosphate-sugar epimerase